VLPPQIDIDLLAVFIETAQELRVAPFFHLYEIPRISSQGGKLGVMEVAVLGEELASQRSPNAKRPPVEMY
jgi:hypothetical protein